MHVIQRCASAAERFEPAGMLHSQRTREPLADGALNETEETPAGKLRAAVKARKSRIERGAVGRAQVEVREEMGAGVARVTGRSTRMVVRWKRILGGCLGG